MRAARRHLAWGWVCLGLAGSLALAAADSQLGDGRPIHWPLVVHLGSRAFAHHVLWAGVGALCVAWLGLGLGLGLPDRWPPRRLLGAGALWALPLALAPALFSNDMYSYLAQGDLLRLGVDPYHHGPDALLGLHQARMAHAVSPFWRHTPAPYGPLFVGLGALVSGLVGSHLALGVVLMRVLELPGFVLLAVFVPRLARRLGADPGRAVWLAVISPLALIELVGGGHNDALLAGMLVAGVSLALDRRPLAAIAVCTLAGMVKLPAGIAVVMILACWWRDARAGAPAATRAGRARAARGLGSGLLVAVGVTAAVGVITGVGWHWVTPALLSTPARVHLAITPGTAAGWSLHALLGPSAGAMEAALGAVAFAVAVAVSLWLLVRVRYERLVPYLGVVLLASVLGGPATWPWYLAWALVLLAVCPRPQRSPALPVVMIASVFVIGPGGTLTLPIEDSPSVLAVYGLAAIALLWAYGRGRGRGSGAPWLGLPRGLRTRPRRLEVAR